MTEVLEPLKKKKKVVPDHQKMMNIVPNDNKCCRCDYEGLERNENFNHKLISGERITGLAYVCPNCGSYFYYHLEGEDLYLNRVRVFRLTEFGYETPSQFGNTANKMVTKKST
jgi:Zn finger protein HypA/HybF involved in hydrogenase expression